MTATLFNSNDTALWESILDQYPEALAHHLASKKDDSLLELDEWYQEALPGILKSRSLAFIDSKELCKLMSWKLKRGKFRPNLLKLAASNSDKDVRRVSQEAFELIPTSLKAAITKMSELKGVGPATASAILCAGAPSEVPFMADETMSSVPGLGTIAYTIPYYIKFATKVIEKAQQLKEKGSTKVYSPHLVEMALWSDYMLDKYNIPKKTTSTTTTTASKSQSHATPNKVTPAGEGTQTKTKGETDGTTSTKKTTKRSAEPTESVSATEKRAKTTTPTHPRTTRRSQ